MSPLTLLLLPALSWRGSEARPEIVSDLQRAAAISVDSPASAAGVR
jgi:hypothetical protein